MRIFITIDLASMLSLMWHLFPRYNQNGSDLSILYVPRWDIESNPRRGRPTLGQLSWPKRVPSTLPIWPRLVPNTLLSYLIGAKQALPKPSKPTMPRPARLLQGLAELARGKSDRSNLWPYPCASILSPCSKDRQYNSIKCYAYHPCLS